MRLVANADGVLLDVNDMFADTLGVDKDDLQNRNLLDTVLFQDFDDIIDDRSIFNNLSSAKDQSPLSNLNAGTHTILIGQNQTPYSFYFDWISGHNGQQYLVASSIAEGENPNWNDVLQKINGNESDNDTSYFAEINRNVQCVLSDEGIILRHNHIYDEKISSDNQSSFLDIIHDEDRATVRQYIQSLNMHDAEDGMDDNGIKFETRMRDQNNKPLWMFWRIHKKNDELYCLGHDITGLKTTELSLKRRDTELSEAQALANMGHWRWVVGSETLEWSDQIFKIFDVSPDDFTPTLDNANARLHKRDIGHMMQAFQRAIIEQQDYDIDFRVVRADQSVGYVQCEGRCEMDADGDVIALYGVMQDVTAQTEHEMELRGAKDSAEQAYASKSRSKIEAGKYELDLEKIQLGDVINTAVRMIESRALDGKIKLNNQIKGKEPIIIADRRAVMQILLNILSNAVKFTKEQGEINISIEEFENHISIKITDNGIGIPANKLSAVLRPFEQVSTEFTRNHEGSGLGLAITKELAELHGGMISLDSTVGEGTVASIRLPKDASQKN